MAPPNKSVRAAMLAAVPSLRAFAISLCGNVDRADDLVQEALLRAWGNLDSFEPGTNMSAWLFTILRNVFCSEYRKRRREVEDADGSYAKSLTSLPGQTSHLEMDEFRKALDVLPSEQRESLILVGASGFSYEEAAQIGCRLRGRRLARVVTVTGRHRPVTDSQSDSRSHDCRSQQRERRVTCARPRVQGGPRLGVHACRRCRSRAYRTKPRSIANCEPSDVHCNRYGRSLRNLFIK
jgi:RNA polymerase sigma-70 factor, ECF subfamily